MLRRALAVVALALTACAHDSVGTVHADAILAAQTFAQLADSASAAGADPAISRGYVGMARTVLAAGNLTPVTIAVDGMTSEWMAVVQEVGYVSPPCPANAVCVAPLPSLRTFLAWKKDDPRRVVQLTSSNASSAIGGATSNIGFAKGPYLNTATLSYFDGRSAMYVAKGGTHTLTTVDASGRCPSASLGGDPALVTPPFASCNQAHFTVAIEATVTTPAIPLKGNTASGLHTLSMGSQSVTGVALALTGATCGTCPVSGYPPLAMPPIDLEPHFALDASLFAVVDSEVTLSLAIANTSSSVQDIQFSTAQQYDFTAVPLGGGGATWRWSEGMAFAQVLSTIRATPGWSIIPMVRWRAPKGTWLVTGRLTSTSHRAEASTTITVP